MVFLSTSIQNAPERPSAVVLDRAGETQLNPVLAGHPHRTSKVKTSGRSGTPNYFYLLLTKSDGVAAR